MTTHTMYQIYDPRDRYYLSFSSGGMSMLWVWVKDKKKAHNFETLRELYNQLLQVPYHGVDSEDDPVNYCKIVKVQVSDPMRSLNMLENDMKAVDAIKTDEFYTAMDKTTADLITKYSGAFKNTIASLKDKRDYLADLLRENVPDISEDEVIHYVHKHLPERNA